jgi:magnesium-transporting ATPase (P-type)
MATLHHAHDGHPLILVKGAPERLLGMCTTQRCEAGGEAPLEPGYWHRRMDEIAARGQRLLALAVRPAAPGQRELRFADVEAGLTLLGLVGIADPPRPEAAEAVARCRAAGIRVKMITGDHAGTARAIAAALGLRNADAVLTGQRLDAMDQEELRRAASTVDVFARTSPEHKLRLVEALQANGEVAAMTGDGVNDAPALKRADVGVAMGQKGTEAAKEAAEVVLADDNFASITAAVEEGRTVYENLRKSILFILPTNGGEALTVMLAIAFGTLLPITPVQILWVNMVTTVTLALAFAFEPGEAGVMERPPRRPSEPLLSGFLAWRIVLVSVIMVAGTFGLFLQERAAGADLATARTVAVNTIVMFEIFYLWNSRHLLASVLSREGLFGSRPALIAIGLVLAFQLLFTYAPPLQFLFETQSLGAGTWLQIVLVASSVLFLVELEKWLLRRRAAVRQ